MTTIDSSVIASGARVDLRVKRLSDAPNDYAWRRDPVLARYDAARPTNLTYEERRERGSRLALRLYNDCAAASEPGMGRWAEMWEMVDAPEVEFVLALSLWEQTGEQVARERVANTYDGVLDAYRRAASAFQDDQHAASGS